MAGSESKRAKGIGGPPGSLLWWLSQVAGLVVSLVVMLVLAAALSMLTRMVVEGRTDPPLHPPTVGVWWLLCTGALLVPMLRETWQELASEQVHVDAAGNELRIDRWSPSEERERFAALVGAGDAMVFTAVLRLVAVWFLVRQAPVITQITGMIGQMGAVAAAVPLSAALHGLGWTRTYTLAASLGVILLFGAFAVIKDSPYERGEVERIKLRALRHSLTEVWRDPGTRLGLSVHFTSQFAPTVFALLWGYPFLVSGQGLSPTTASTLLTLMTFVALVAGPTIGRWTGRNPYYRSVVALGVVIRGGTPHFEYVCRGVTDGLREVMRDADVPVGFGVLTTDSVDQARAAVGLDLVVQLEDRVGEHLRPRRAAGQVHVHRDDVVDALHDGVVVEHAAGAGAHAHRDDPLRLGHLVVDLAHDRGHLVAHATGDDHQVGLARRRREALHAEAGQVVVRRADGHHLDGAAGQPEGRGPDRRLAHVARKVFDGRQRDPGRQLLFDPH